jgi:hypothetical protein
MNAKECFDTLMQMRTELLKIHCTLTNQEIAVHVDRAADRLCSAMHELWKEIDDGN